MWRRTFTLDTDLSPSRVWAGLCALETGAVPMNNGDGRRLDGPFEVGGTISSTPAGLGRTLESTIIELIPDERLAVQTPFNTLVLQLRHTLQPLEGGGTRISRELEISGDDADEQGPIAGPRISDDYDEALAEIVSVSRTQK